MCIRDRAYTLAYLIRETPYLLLYFLLYETKIPTLTEIPTLKKISKLLTLFPTVKDLYRTPQGN